MHEIACAANRFEILNNNTPTKSAISEPDMAEMEEFLANARMLVSTLGYKVFEPLREGGAEVGEGDNHFFLKGARGAEAQGEPSSEGFVVLKDSTLAIDHVKSCHSYVVKLRESLIEKEVVVENGESLTLVSDYLFTSPSTAAAVVMARTANGLIEWKTKDGRTLKMVESG